MDSKTTKPQTTSSRPKWTTIGSNPTPQQITPDTSFSQAIVPPAPGCEDPKITQRQLEALNRWRSLAGDHPTAQVTVTAGGKETIQDTTGTIGDSPAEADLLLAIKGTREYKDGASKARTQAKAAAAQAIQNFESRLDALASIGDLAPTPQDLAWYESNLADVQSWHVDPEPFDEPEPSLDAIAQELGREARAAVNPFAFWKTKQLRLGYIAQRAQDRVTAALQGWEARRNAFLAAQTERAQSLEAARESAIDWLTKAMEGDPSYVTEKTIQSLTELNLPLDLSLQLSFEAPTLTIMASFDPEKTFPQERPSTLKTGWLRTKPMSKKDLSTLVDQLTPELGHVLAAVGFDVSPAIEQARVNLYSDNMVLGEYEYTRTQ
ncbi:hypothetical protein HGI81_07630 [Olsenella sp. KGMB02461]|nr:hypothetical protein [Olsenella sp. KGMB02461]